MLLERDKTQQIALRLGLAIFFIGIGIYAYLGIFFRYWADDWCYNADFRNLGFLETLSGYAYNVTYTPSRYSVTILAGFFYPLGVFGLQILLPLSLLIWTWGLVRLFGRVSSLSGYPLSTRQAWLLSLMTVFFSVHFAPHLYQSLYWNTGFFTYTFPLVLIPWVLTLVTDQNPSVLKGFILALLTILTGGFSEAGSTVLVSTLTLYTVIAFIGSRNQKPWARITLPSAFTALIFALVAMALLVVAPTTQIRAERYGEPAGLMELSVLLFNFTREFVTLSIKDAGHLLVFVLAGLFGFIVSDQQERKIHLLKAAFLGAGIFGVAALLVAASLAPSAYIERGLPILRTQIIPRHILVLAFAAIGWILGFSFRASDLSAWLRPVASVALLAAMVFPMIAVFTASKNIPIHRERAMLWDEREAVILAAIADSQDRVPVLAIDGAPVGGIRDFDPPDKKGFWITRCAMDYYGIRFQVHLP